MPSRSSGTAASLHRKLTQVMRFGVIHETSAMSAFTRLPTGPPSITLHHSLFQRERMAR